MRSLVKFLMLFALVLMVPATFAGCGPAGELSPSDSQASPAEEESDAEGESEVEFEDSATDSSEEEAEMEEEL